jgi:hypothetical protein
VHAGRWVSALEKGSDGKRITLTTKSNDRAKWVLLSLPLSVYLVCILVVLFSTPRLCRCRSHCPISLLSHCHSFPSVQA